MVFLLLACVLLTAMVSVPEQHPNIVKSTELHGDEEFQYEVVVERDYKLLGDTIAASLEDLRTANDSLLDWTAVEEADLLLTVNGAPVTRQEWAYRKGMAAIDPQQRPERETLQVLIREKVQQAKAMEAGLLPTEEEIQAYLQEEWQLMQESQGQKEAEDFKAVVDETALTEEAYWNVYERYNVIRILLNEKLRKVYMEGPDAIADYEDYVAEVDRWAREAHVVYHQKLSWKLF